MVIFRRYVNVYQRVRKIEIQNSQCNVGIVNGYLNVCVCVFRYMRVCLYEILGYSGNHNDEQIIMNSKSLLFHGI